MKLAASLATIAAVTFCAVQCDSSLASYTTLVSASAAAVRGAALAQPAPEAAR